MADVLARVSGLYTWDDHEIMDGWGSLPPAMMENPVVQDAGWAAAATFRAFQMGVDPTADRPHHFQAVSLGDGVEIVMLDTRWQRRMDQILAEGPVASLQGPPVEPPWAVRRGPTSPAGSGGGPCGARALPAHDERSSR